jgi:hypothetical protein
MSTAKIAFSGFDASIAAYELTQIGPINPDAHFAPAASIVATILAGQDTFTFPAPTAPGDYTFSVQAYDANHVAAQGPQSVNAFVPVAPPGPPAPGADNIPAAITVTLG